MDGSKLEQKKHKWGSKSNKKIKNKSKSISKKSITRNKKYKTYEKITKLNIIINTYKIKIAIKTWFTIKN